MGLIYLSRNKINGMGYVGQTKKTIKSRIYAHSRSQSSPFTVALKELGEEKFSFCVIEDNVPDEMLTERENFHIWNEKTYTPYGYNIVYYCTDKEKRSMDFCSIIEVRRDGRKMTWLSRKTKIGLSELSLAMSGKAPLSEANIIKIAKVLNIDHLDLSTPRNKRPFNSIEEDDELTRISNALNVVFPNQSKQVQQ